MPTLTDFVPAEESVLVRWEGALRDGNGSEEVVLGTTDHSLVFCSETGRFGVYPRDHVSAVESRVRTETRYDGVDYRLVVGGGSVLTVAAFAGAVVVNSSALALALVLVAAAGVWVADHGWRNREAFDGIERTESKVERVTVRTDDGVRREFVFPVEDRAAARLGEFVQSE